jgi:hypothetical protein
MTPEQLEMRKGAAVADESRVMVTATAVVFGIASRLAFERPGTTDGVASGAAS